jgi:hypothetical protein
MTAASEPAPPDTPTLTQPQAAPSQPRRRFSSKQVKVLVIVVVVAVVVVVLLWGMVPERIIDAGQVVKDPAGYKGKTIFVKGTVVSWNMGSRNFTLADPLNRAATLNVTYSGAFPSGFGLNVSAIVKGTINLVGGVPRMDSIEIQIGCPSKY